jgi:hypothetical protein
MIYSAIRYRIFSIRLNRMSRPICIGRISLHNYLLNIQLTDGASSPKRKSNTNSILVYKPGSPSNIVWVVQSDQADMHWIFTGCIHGLAWKPIQYCVGGTVGSGGYTLNIHWVYPSVSLKAHPILCGWYHRIRQIHTKYSLGVSIG